MTDLTLPTNPDVNMKPMLGFLVQEAVKLALVDSCDALFLLDGGDVAVGHRFNDVLQAERGPSWLDFAASMRDFDPREPGEEMNTWAIGWEHGPARANGVVSEVHLLEEGCSHVVLDDLQALRYRVPHGEKFIVRRHLTREERAKMRADQYAGPKYVDFDPGALAQNVACRLLGTGGWEVGGVYAGNASPREIFEITFARPDRSETAEIAHDMGLGPEIL